MDRQISRGLLLTLIGIAFMFIPREAFQLLKFLFGPGVGTFITFVHGAFMLGGVLLITYVLLKVKINL